MLAPFPRDATRTRNFFAMTTLVTGANGGFGRFLSAWLSKYSTGPVVLSSRSPGPDGDCLQCDVSDRVAVRELVRYVRPRLVYHLAATFSNQFEGDYAVNALGARNLLGAVLEERLDARLVVLGSAAEYGIILPEENPVGEDRVLRPVSVYGLTKAMQTHLAGYYAHQHMVDVVVARMFNLWAPGLSDRLFVGRAERLIEQYRRGEIETIDVGNLDNQRDYIDADDAAEQIALIAARGRRGSIYHVASGQPVIVRDVLRRMLDAADVPFAVVRERKTTNARAGFDPPIIYADMRRTRALENDARVPDFADRS
jgi:GDP-4-dehydro-6-deoxy-D-mannose reductase